MKIEFGNITSEIGNFKEEILKVCENLRHPEKMDHVIESIFYSTETGEVFDIRKHYLDGCPLIWTDLEKIVLNKGKVFKIKLTIGEDEIRCVIKDLEKGDLIIASGSAKVYKNYI